jgi:hypothetical protein
MKVSERKISIDEVMQAGRAGTLREMWGTGTAAVVSPVGELGYKGEKLSIGNGHTGIADAEALRLHRRYPVRHAGRSAWLDQRGEGAGGRLIRLEALNQLNLNLGAACRISGVQGESHARTAA